jgi:hypothetical protein
MWLGWSKPNTKGNQAAKVPRLKLSLKAQPKAQPKATSKVSDKEVGKFCGE